MLFNKLEYKPTKLDQKYMLDLSKSIFNEDFTYNEKIGLNAQYTNKKLTIISSTAEMVHSKRVIIITCIDEIDYNTLMSYLNTSNQYIIDFTYNKTVGFIPVMDDSIKL